MVGAAPKNTASKPRVAVLDEAADKRDNSCQAGQRSASNPVHKVGNHPCLCVGVPHRTWRCRECDALWVWPPCRDRPEWAAWWR